MKSLEDKAKECALKEGIDPDYNWTQIGMSWCPHGTGYTFKNIYSAGYRQALKDMMERVKDYGSYINTLDLKEIAEDLGGK